MSDYEGDWRPSVGEFVVWTLEDGTRRLGCMLRPRDSGQYWGRVAEMLARLVATMHVYRTMPLAPVSEAEEQMINAALNDTPRLDVLRKAVRRYREALREKALAEERLEAVFSCCGGNDDAVHREHTQDCDVWIERERADLAIESAAELFRKTPKLYRSFAEDKWLELYAPGEENDR